MSSRDAVFESRGPIQHAKTVPSFANLPKKSGYSPYRRDFPVSRQFRAFIANEFEGFESDESLRWFLLNVLLRPHHDEDSGLVVLSYKMLAACYYMDKKADQGNARGDKNTGSFLFYLRNTHINKLIWDPEDRIKGKSRTMSEKSFRYTLWRELENELNKDHMLYNMIYFVSGKKVNKKRSRLDVSESKSHYRIRSYSAPLEEQKNLLLYINGPSLSNHLFSRTLQYLPEARAAIRESGKSRPSITSDLRKLRAIEQQPRPFYAHSSKGNTVRIFAQGDSLPTLSRVARSVLLQDFVSVDLRSAQAAIIAKLWSIEPLLTLLSSGKSLWKALADSLGAAYRPNHKDAHKAAFYALVFGGGEWKARQEMRDNCANLPRGFEDAFFTHPIISATLEAREEAIRQVQEQGGAWDAWGQWQAISPSREPRKILATVAQSYEFLLMQPLVNMALQEAEKERPEFEIAAWLHDGAYLSFRRKDPKRIASHLERIKGAVDEQAKSLGFLTELELPESYKASGSSLVIEQRIGRAVS